MKNINRCDWVGINKTHYEVYHDTECGVPEYDDQKLFEMLILEGAQAVLTWETILKRCENYRKLFHNFDPVKVARLTDARLEKILLDPGVIRNRLKIYATRKNAQVFLSIQKEYGSFSTYLWNFVDSKPIDNKPRTLKHIPTSTTISDALSKDLKKRGMSFVGSTIMYAYMQAIGMVNDHVADCFVRTINRR